MRTESVPLLSGADLSAASATSIAMTIDQIFAFSVVATVTGVAAGTLKVQVSNDVVKSPSFPPTHWVDLASATVSVSGAGVVIIPKTEVCYEWMRLVYTKDTSTGSPVMTAMVKCNGF